MHALITTSAVALTMAAALIGHSPLTRADNLDGTVTTAGRTVTISYRELDISKPWGLEVLYSRIQNAARSVCGFDYSVQELSRARIAKNCYRAAVDDAVRQINRPTLTALHRTKMKSAFG